MKEFTGVWCGCYVESLGSGFKFKTHEYITEPMQVTVFTDDDDYFRMKDNYQREHEIIEKIAIINDEGVKEMYKEYLIVAEMPNHEDTKIYWDSTEQEAIADITALKSAGYEVEAHKVKVEKVFDEMENKFLFV